MVFVYAFISAGVVYQVEYGAAMFIVVAKTIYGEMRDGICCCRGEPVSSLIFTESKATRAS